VVDGSGKIFVGRYRIIRCISGARPETIAGSVTSDTQTKLHETFNAVGTQTILYIKTNGLLISWLTSFPVTFTSLGLDPLPVSITSHQFNRPAPTAERNSVGGCSPEPKTQHLTDATNPARILPSTRNRQQRILEYLHIAKRSSTNSSQTFQCASLTGRVRKVSIAHSGSAWLMQSG